MVFWAFFEQAGSSMNLFTERNVDKQLFGMRIQASQFQAFNPAFIILLAPVFSWLWVALARRRFEPSTPAKFGLGVVQVGLGFAALVYGAQQADTNGIVAAGWLALAYLLHTTGELCLSPVGLSMVTKLSVPRVVGLMMGVWFLSSAFSHYVAGLIAAGASVSETPGAAVVGGVDSLAIYVGDVRLSRVGRRRGRSSSCSRCRRWCAASHARRRVRNRVATGLASSTRRRAASCGREIVFLLAVHHSYLPYSRVRWGLPGGRIEIGESAEAAARREVAEELSIELGELFDCGDYRYKGARHKVFGTRYDGAVSTFDHD